MGGDGGSGEVAVDQEGSMTHWCGERMMRERVGIFQEVLVHYKLGGDNYVDST